MKNKRLIIGAAAIFIVLLIGLAVVYRFVFLLNKTPVDVIDPPPTLTLPETEPVQPIDEIPEDIDQDFLHEPVELEKVPIYKQINLDANYLNVLLIGTDQRPNESGYGRSDSMMLASFDIENRDITLISLMRDTWISIPDHGSNRINAAYAFGGIGLAINTVNLNFDLDIQKYVVVDFESLPKIINKLGGVSVDLTLREIEIINQENSADQLPVSEGIHHLNGKQALTHSRNRSTGDGDFSRTRRQRDIMAASMQQLRQNTRPAHLASLITGILPLINTNLTYNELIQLSRGFIGPDSFSLVHDRIPQDGTWQYAEKSGHSVITIDLPANRDFMHTIIYSED